MTCTVPPDLGLALSFARLSQGWTQQQLGEVCGVSASLISNYERGHKDLTRERLEEMLLAMGRSPGSVEEALGVVRKFRAGSPVANPLDPEAWRAEAAANEAGRLIAEASLKALNVLRSASRALVAREEAAALWPRLKNLAPAHRLLVVKKAPEFRSWAVCELVCEESVKAAVDSADRAVELADLALRIAELTPGDDAWRSRLQGYAWAHVGNARRVRGDLRGADQAFVRSRKLWRAGASSETGLIDEARVLDLEASLRRDQTRFGEALELLEQALVADQGLLKKRLLINKATVLEALGDFTGAVVALHQAEPFVRAGSDPRLFLVVRFNLAVNLCFLGQYEDAEKLLPEMRALTVSLGNGLDSIRFLWLEGRVAAGVGHREEAVLALSRVREEFATRGIGYDTALASLELAVLYLEDQRTADVRTLARQMAPIFQTQGIHREALAALKLFRDAAEREALTLDLARRLVAYLQRAQHNPELRFEGD